MKISFNWNRKNKSNPFARAVEDCLSKEEADKLKFLDIEKILLLSTEERLRIFSSLIGSKAEWFNSRFEKDYVLNNQKAGMLNWANKTKMEEKFRQEIVRKISNLEKMLNPAEEESFINELANLALGIGVTQEEEKTLIELSHKADEARLKMENGGSKEDYEKAHNLLQAYVNKLKNS